MIYKLSMLVLALAMGLLLYIAYLTFFPLNIVNLHSIGIYPPEVRPGSEVRITMDFTKNLDYKPDIRYSLVCKDRVYNIDNTAVSRPTGKGEYVTIKTIPLATKAPDTCKVQIDISYDVTAFRTINYMWVTDEIQIKN